MMKGAYLINDDKSVMVDINICVNDGCWTLVLQDDHRLQGSRSSNGWREIVVLCFNLFL